MFFLIINAKFHLYMERLLECSKPEGSKVCDKVKPRIFDWEVVERYDGLVVDRNGAYPQMVLYREGGDKKFIVIESILQQGLLITAHDETTVWTFIRCNGLFLYIKPTCRIQYTNGYFFEVYEYAKGIVVYFFNSEGKITGRKLFDCGYRKKGRWFFENEVAIYKVVMKDDPMRLSVVFYKHQPRRHWYWPFWKF